MKFTVDPRIFEQYRDLKIGAILLKGINNTRRSSPVESLLRGICAQRGKEFALKDMHEDPAVQVWDKAYGMFGVNPRKFPPSIAALLKRVKSGKEIPHINLLVDIYNYFSLKFLLPVGGEDLDWLCGDLNLTFTKGKEPFRPLGSIEVEKAAEGEVAYLDNGGITCRFWNHRECERTKFTERTTNALILVEDLSRMHMDNFGKILMEISDGFQKYIGGQIMSYIITEENSSIELGIEGRKGVDDSKIPQQEKKFFLEKQELTKKKPGRPKSKKSRLKKEKATQMSFIEENEPLHLDDPNCLKEKIKSAISVAVIKSFPQILYPAIELSVPSTSSHGDYACNIALKLAKELGLKPDKIAEAIIKHLDEPELLEKVEIAGPGFINFFISKEYLQHEMRKIITEKGAYGSSKIGNNKTVLLDYSSPNIAKPLGVHHLLSTIIGQSIYDIFKFLGFDCVSINHIGDWGTQFGKLIAAYKKWGSKEEIEKDPINEMLKLYVKFHDEVEKNPDTENEGREEFNKFEKGDKENQELWKWFVKESLKDLDKTYKKLGAVHFDKVMGESFYEDKLQDILEDGKKREIFVRGEEGAFIVKYDDSNMPPMVVQKKDGASLYSTRDFATLRYRVQQWHPLRILYVVDSAQSMYFKQLFKAAERFPWYHGEAEHIAFGRMSFPDGQMSTRKGNIVRLDDVIDEAIVRAQKIIEEKNANLENKDLVAAVLGVGAIKYNILSQNRSTDITFEWDKMLSLEGNSAPYLQYTYARGRSIIRKSTRKEGKEAAENPMKDPENTEEKTWELIRMFPKFSEIIATSAQEYKPNLLATFLYEFAQVFNSFYHGIPVLRAEKEETRRFRLKVVQCAGQILKNGLELLGIDVIEEM